MIKKYGLYLLLTIFTVSICEAQCVGRFVNPVTDICWKCIFPLSIGSTRLYEGGQIDTKNPSNPLCICKKGMVPTPGFSIGFWEPLSMIEATRTPYCLVSMGGLKLASSGLKGQGGRSGKTDIGNAKETAFYNVHYYHYPVLHWLKLLIDFACMEKGELDIAYLSELDPTWNRSSLGAILNGEAILFGNPIAQAACAGDCIKATKSFGFNQLFWCSGCQGSLYPFSGHVGAFVGAIQASHLVTGRLLAKFHRLTILKQTASSKKALCDKKIAPILKKDQYKIQMLYPKAATKGKDACNPIGKSTAKHGSGKEYPKKGEDYSYLIWRKRNCCLL